MSEHDLDLLAEVQHVVRTIGDFLAGGIAEWEPDPCPPEWRDPQPRRLAA